MKSFKFLPRLISGFGLLMTLIGEAEAGNVALTLTFTDSPDPVAVSSSLTYTLNVANSNLERADSVKVTVPLPAGATYVSGCSLSGSNVICDFGDIAKNTNETLSFSVTAQATSGTMSATGTITTSDTNTLTNTKTITTTVNDLSGFACPNPRAFTSQVNLNMFGNSRIIGNSNMCKNDGGVCGDPGTSRNNDINMMYSDPDGATNTTTFNASSALLSLPAGSTVRWAKLYWQGYLVNQNDTVKTSSKQILFSKPGEAYQTIDSSFPGYDYNWIYFTSDRYYYQGSADVTALIQAGGNGNYTAANIISTIGQPIGGSFGAWSLVIAYEDPNDSFKNVTIFDGYQGIVTAGDQTTATTYATGLGCGTNTGARNTMTIPLSGFLTPKSGAVKSSLSVFAGEGDKGATGDHLMLTDVNGGSHYVANALNSYDDIFNSTITYNGTTVTNTTSPVAITPYHSSNSNGIDIDTFDVSKDKDNLPLITNNQTSTNVTLDTNGDGYMPGVFAFTTDLYTPKFCYDYGYEQNGRPFTEDNNGTKMPYITGFIPNTADINVSIYIKNMENSDVNASNVMMNIYDINASEAIYTPNSVAVTYPNTYLPISKADSSWPLISSDTYIRNIPMGNIGGSEYAYTYYSLSPTTVGNMSMPIVGTFAYDLTIPLPNGTTLTLPYSSTIGGSRLPMCSANNFSYTPTRGIFSMVDAGLYDATDASKRYYDLTTQVVKRPANLRIASFDPTALDTPKPVSTMVAVEMIDASQFHDVNAACTEPSSAITPRIWMTFDNNVSQINFNRSTINTAITNGLVSDAITGQPVTLASAEDFFKIATPNAAFRITFNTLNDANESLIDLVPTTNGVRINNFANIHQIYPHCRKYVTNPNNANMTNTTSVACSDNGNNSTYRDVAICMECLYGADTKVLCSRDNFAIRPESYTVTLKDLDKTNHAITQVFAPGHTGVVAPNTAQVNMAAGYTYGYDINATSHIDNSNALGYTRYFGTSDNDFNISLVWNPSVAKTGCNDTNSSSEAFVLVDGTVAAEGTHNQVGEYMLDIIDKTWTAVDWNPASQGHQIGSHYLSGVECVENSNIVPTQVTTVGLSGTTLTNLVGCNISSIHNNLDNNLQYRNYNLAFKPYDFNLTSVQFSTGTEFNVSAINQNVWTYMNNVHVDENMSARYSGKIIAQGENGSSLTNFVNNCYSEPINFELNLTFPTTANLPNWRYRLQEVNSTTQIWNDTNAVILSPASSSAFNLLTVPASGFLKNQNGMIDVNLSVNFDRNQALPVNPITVGLNNLQVKCNPTVDCSSNADMIANHLPDANVTTNSNVTFAYGRLLTKDIRVFGNIAFTANGWYEVFNHDTTIPFTASLQPSKNGIDWFVNSGHNDMSHGDANVTRLISSGTATAVNYGGNEVNGVEGFEFAAINPTYNGKAHVDTAPWLWYAPNALLYSDPSTTNPTNAAGNDAACLTHPCFNVTVMPAIGATGSAKDTNEATKASKRSTGGGAWRSTTDYAPAIR